MKKFLASLFILSVFSVCVFYIGWTQFKLQPDNMGVVVSKTSGISEEPVINGKMSWYWQFLLPTNAELKQFNIKPVSVSRTVKGQLPSGDVYTSFYNSSDSFSYFFDFSISVTVSPEAVVELYKLNMISDSSDLQDYLCGAADTLAQLAADYYLKKASESSAFRPESVRRDDLLKTVQLYKECPLVDVSIFALTESKIPDYVLYRKLQAGFQVNSFTENLQQNENINSKSIDNMETADSTEFAAGV